MRIAEICPQPDCTLSIVADDGRIGIFDVGPYLDDDAFADLRDPSEFAKVCNGGYFVEWACGADLSADTIEARWRVVGLANAAETALRTHGAQANVPEACSIVPPVFPIYRKTNG